MPKMSAIRIRLAKAGGSPPGRGRRGRGARGDRASLICWEGPSFDDLRGVQKPLQRLGPALLESTQTDTLPAASGGCQGRRTGCGWSSASPPTSRPPCAGGGGRRGWRCGRCSRRSRGRAARGRARYRALRIESLPARGEELAVAGVAGGQHAVEHVDRRAPRPPRGPPGCPRPSGSAACPRAGWDRGASSTREHVLLGLAHREPADRVAGEAEGGDLRARSARAGRGGRRPARSRTATGRGGVCASRLRRAQRVVRAVASATASRGAG